MILALLPSLRDRFRQMPIRRKLRIVFLLTTLTSLLLAGAGLVALDSFLFYRNLERQLATFVEVVGDNNAAALAFDDPVAGAQALAALRFRTHIETACLYHLDDTLLATYRRTGYTGACPEPAGNTLRRQNGALAVSYGISRDGQPMGTLVLSYDLGELGERALLYGGAVLLALLFSSALVLASSSRLRGLIAAPVLELADAAGAVAKKKDYGIRVKKTSDDEFGVLADALNQMMEAIQSRDNDLKQSLEVQRDVLDRLERANAQLKRTNAELARSNQDLERFAFVASHDLQEPLRMITSYSQLLVAEYPGQGGRASQFVDQIVGGTSRMRELLSDLRTYTDVAGSSEQPLEPVDLNLVLERVLQTLGVAAAESGAQIQVDCLPLLRAHEGRMTSVFLNLIGNAIKYRGEEPPRIHVSFQQEASALAFAVADNGIGIAPEYHRKVFTAFRRLHGRSIPGTGIGLAICQRIVEGYGGRIWVESELGQGATFRFTLPLSMTAMETEQRAETK